MTASIFSGDDANKFYEIEVNIFESAFGNVKAYHTMRKELLSKEIRTQEATKKALNSAKKKSDKMMKQTEAIVKIEKQRKYLWFERFHWFISSQNYLVLGGRDQQQNSFLVRKHLLSDDLFVHSTIHGGSVVIIKNPSGGSVPIKTLNEAAQMAVCYSKSWETKVISDAYWVYSSQVSKVAPSGSYISPGSFMITGKRNFLNVHSLVLGYGLFFKISDEDAEKHKNDTRFQSTNNIDLTEQNHDYEEDVLDDVIHTTAVGETMFLQDVRMPSKKKTQKICKAPKKQSKSKSKPAQNVDKFNAPSTDVSNKKQNHIKNKHKNYTEDYEEIKKITKQLEGKTFIHDPEDKNNSDKDDDKSQIESPKSEGLDLNSNVDNQHFLEVDMSDKIIDTNSQSDCSEIEISDAEDTSNDKNKEDDENMHSTDILNSLIENPFADDEMMFCLASVAPYSAISNCRFKAKLQPGATKRGKAAKQIIHFFIQNKLTSTTEKTILKAMKDTELCQNFPGSVKITLMRVTENDQGNGNIGEKDVEETQMSKSVE
ncbi:hypothetical protein GJ496_011382 [Pomphorhynchus laevis]|nr:hypothetical protein GJ496_011382 [Pomphorhynchus laevis]